MFKPDNSLEKKYIFLSASFPSRDRDSKYYSTSNKQFITAAVIAIVKGIFNRKGILIFGGHPLISPLILRIAKNYYLMDSSSDLPFMYIYQSEFFKEKIVNSTKDLEDNNIGKIVWIESINTDRAKSLTYMRKCMIGEKKPAAAIFIGGMEGIEEEFDIFIKKYPYTPVYLISSAGGATKLLFDDYFLNQDKRNFKWKYNSPDLLFQLNKSDHYPFLAKQIFFDITTKLK